LEEGGFSREEAYDVHHNQVDQEFLAKFGMGPFRMGPSFRETYLRLCSIQGRLPDPEIANRCEALGRDFLGHPRVMHGTLEALEALASQIPTVIFSQAAQIEYQLGRIRDAGVTRILSEERIRITERKTADTFRETIAHFGLRDSSDATMIGNSLRSDINPALLAGAQAILVEPYEMWHYDKVPPVSDGFLRFETFPEAVEFLLARGTAQTSVSDGPVTTQPEKSGG
jgi:putative hydrolase of the HAD superfamily